MHMAMITSHLRFGVHGFQSSRCVLRRQASVEIPQSIYSPKRRAENYFNSKP